jgi:hypothetical protein
VENLTVTALARPAVVALADRQTDDALEPAKQRLAGREDVLGSTNVDAGLKGIVVRALHRSAPRSEDETTEDTETNRWISVSSVVRSPFDRVSP